RRGGAAGGAGGAGGPARGGAGGPGAGGPARLGVALPALGESTVGRLSAVLPLAAVAANPLDYTAVIFGEVEPTAELVAAVGTDDALGAVLVTYDQPHGLGDDARATSDGALARVPPA